MMDGSSPSSSTLSRDELFDLLHMVAAGCDLHGVAKRALIGMARDAPGVASVMGDPSMLLAVDAYAEAFRAQLLAIFHWNGTPGQTIRLADACDAYAKALEHVAEMVQQTLAARAGGRMQ